MSTKVRAPFYRTLKDRVRSINDRHLSIRSHLILLVVAALLPVLIFAGIMFWQHVELQRATMDRGMRDTARALSLAVDREIGQVREVLETLAASPYLDSQDFKAFYELSSRAAKEHNDSSIVLLDRSGQQITNTLRPFGALLPNAVRHAKAPSADDTDELPQGTPEAAQRVIDSGNPFVTDLFMGIVSKRPTVSINVPVIRDDQVIYVLKMGIMPENLTALLVEGRFPSDWYAVIVDRKGLIISRHPDPERFVGRPLTNLRDLVGYVDEGWGAGRTREGIDIYRSFFRSKSTGWTVSVGAPQASVDAPVNRSIRILGLGATALTFVAFGIAAILGKRISAPLMSLARSAEAIQRGEKLEIERSNVREVAELHSELIRSVTDRQKLEEQLRHSQKIEAIGTLAGGIAHDFNNTLNIIQAYATLISKQASADEHIIESTKVISDEVTRGAAVVRQLMTIARKTEVSLGRTDLNQLILTVSNLLRQTFPRTIELELKLDRTLNPVLADSNQITQAILNLCVNARDAMPQGGSLTLATELIGSPAYGSRHGELSPNPYVCIAVTDTGSGMDEAVRSRAFEPFFTTKSVGEGTGLGLAMVYGIAKTHNGTVHIESEPGVGTIVRLYLPALLHEDAYPASDVSSKDIVPNRKLAEHSTILVVEDERAMVQLLGTGLSQEGYGVLTARDGADAIDVYQRHRSDIDVILLDLGLPKVSGLDVIRKVRKLNEDVKIIVTTGYLEPELKSELIAAGVNECIQKPYMIPDILQRISHHLSSADSSPEPTIH